MPFIPHTEAETKQMLATIGVKSTSELFAEIPAELLGNHLKDVPAGMNELEMIQHMQSLAEQDAGVKCFIGAGAYEHHIPAAVWDITARGEFYSAYTPYQAEASQGTLQLLYEFQSMICGLTGMDVANASMYDGATALAEAILMAVRSNKKSKSKTVLIPESLHPLYRQTVATVIGQQNIELVDVRVDDKTGRVAESTLANYAGKDITALVIPMPNFFGVLEDVDALTDFAAENNMLSIAVVNPMALAVLKAPGDWGKAGADITCGEGQPLGSPLSSGGPYFGFLTTKQQYVRQLPGRISGCTVDLDGKTGFTLTLQAREQHIRRSKATSNICTNQGLLVTAATIYMSIMGEQGLRQVALKSHQNTRKLLQSITQIPGVKQKFSGEFFHEVVVQLPKDAQVVLNKMQEKGILAGLDVFNYQKSLSDCITICVTETKTDQDIAQYHQALATCLA